MTIKNRILPQLIQNKAEGVKSFAVLLDPDKTTPESCLKILARPGKVSYFFVGGSLITDGNLNSIVKTIKSHSDIPVILFPGSNLHIDNQADAILFLSLISGRNPEFLIGQQVVSAPVLKKSGLEILPTGYLLIDGGKPTTVSYISNTFPIPADKPEVAACTALAGEMLGLKLIYLDAGSGAMQEISPEMIKMVTKTIEVPLIVGGGINSAEKAAKAWHAGADLIVVGNGIEKNPDLLTQISEKMEMMNSANLKSEIL